METPQPASDLRMSDPHAASPSAFELIGGETTINTLVERFYDLMDLEPALKELRAAHGPQLDSARQKLAGLLGMTGDTNDGAGG